MYNERVQKAVAHLKSSLPRFALVEEVDVVRKGNKQTVILMENGRFYGMGYLPDHISISSLEQVKPLITPYPENDYIRGLIYQHAGKYPEKKIEWVA
jgi:DNA polymerase-3 subunit epsilon